MELEPEITAITVGNPGPHSPLHSSFFPLPCKPSTVVPVTRRYAIDQPLDSVTSGVLTGLWSFGWVIVNSGE